jgi:hypothetical protein
VHFAFCALPPIVRVLPSASCHLSRRHSRLNRTRSCRTPLTVATLVSRWTMSISWPRTS